MRNLLRLIIRFIFNCIARFDIQGWEHLPARGAFIIVANHIGAVDPGIVFYALDRWNLVLPVAEKWRELGLIRWLGQYLNFVFIERFKADVGALKHIMALMKAGNILIIAPEGTRSPNGALIEGKPGASYLAAKLGLPILPVAITGTRDTIIKNNIKHLRRSPISVTGGPTFTLPPLPTHDREAALQQSTDEIMCRIAALLPPDMRGVYTEHPRLQELLIQNTNRS